MDIRQIKTTIRIAGAEVPAPIYSLAYRIGQGVPEATEIVLEQIGRSDLYWAWISAKQEADLLSAREPAEGDDFMSMLKPASPELAAANTRCHQAWQSIQALIDVAREHIDSLGHDGAPS